MNKELFVSSTPHETKVGLVEDDLLAEIYLERENEYTLAGSIYKGRVTRVLPGMQSAFVDIGLERDAFLYVSDFMELEEQDEDLTEAVPANRSVQDLRPQPVQSAVPQAGEAVAEDRTAASGDEDEPSTEGTAELGEAEAEGESSVRAGGAVDSANNGESQNRERGGNWRGRRRRRGGRRDGRSDGRGPDRDSERGPERSSESRSSESRSTESRSSEPRSSEPRSPERNSESRFGRGGADAPRRESGRSQPSGPPPGYQPILLPGESISKYSRLAQQPQPAPAHDEHEETEAISEARAESAVPAASTFPEDEPIFAAGTAVAEPLHEEHDDTHSFHEEPAESASTSSNWNQEFRRDETVSAASPVHEAPHADEIRIVDEGTFEEETLDESPDESDDRLTAAAEHTDLPASREEQTPAFAAPGTMEEETIDEEEADTIRYESSSDEGYDEFEEETQAAGSRHINGDARDAVSEIHLAEASLG
jgi:hypothetical protein